MRFDLSEDQTMLRTSTAEVLADLSPIEVSRRVAEADGEGFSREHWKKLAELGYLGLVAPESCGGQALGPIELAVVAEELGKVCFPGPVLDAIFAMRILELAGGQESVIGEIVRGGAIVVPATADRVWAGESGATTFRDGRVRGVRFFVPYGASADGLLVAADRDLLLVDGSFQAEPMETLDDAARFTEVALDNPARRIGDASLLERVTDVVAVAVAAHALGLCESAMRAAVAYSRERKTFGKPIGAYQALQHRMADMLVRAESTRSITYRAAWCVATGAREATMAAAAAKAYAVESANRVAEEAIQIHGGNGFTWEYDLHRYLKRARTLDQHYGTTAAMTDRTLRAFEAHP